MTSLMRCIALDEIAQFEGFPEGLAQHARLSEPLIGGFVDGAPFCIVGLIPEAEGQAHIWGWNTPLVAKHPYIYARQARRLIEHLLSRYPTITGYCTPNKHKWIQSFGGTIIESTEALSYFEVHRHAHA